LVYESRNGKQAVSGMIEQDYIYFDTFDDTYVLQKAPNAPPERYIMLYKGMMNFYTESYAVKVDGKDEDLCLSVAFDEEQYDNIHIHDLILKAQCERNNCTLSHLRYIVMPPTAFNQVIGYAERAMKVNADD
jgi:hypothetical protein